MQFSETPERNLEYQKTEYDISRESLRESGHVINSDGDSGSPFWTIQYLDNEGKAVLVALTQGKYAKIHGVHGEYLNDPNQQCRNLAIKITKEMIDWLEMTERPIRELNQLIS